jgi:hypothetical protein
MSNLIFDKSLGFFPQAMSCDRHDFYFATGDQKGFSMLKIN